MKKSFNNKTNIQIFMYILRFILSAAVIIFGLLQIFNVWNRAIYVSVPLMGVVLLIQSIQEWHKCRGTAILGFICTIFIFICTVVSFISII